MTALVDALRRLVAGRVAENVELAAFTTYRLGGRAAVLVEPDGPGDLEAIARERTRRVDDDGTAIPVLPLGRGSNLVISDDGWPGIVIRIGPAFGAISGGPVVTAGAGVTLPVLANHAARRGWAGVEFGIAIPGSVGGGVRMNAGAHGSDVAATLTEARVTSLGRGESACLTAVELDFSYRHSSLTDEDVVVDATFELAPDDPARVRDTMEGYRRHRAETQPGAAQNAGSVFKNPPGDHAGRLVDAAGLKGFRVGGAEVSQLHANFFIARPGASATDVYSLVAAVRTRVAERFGVELEPEVRFVGRFATPAGVQA